MKVLVTGATGGLGELVIAQLLKQDVEVIATSRDAAKAAESFSSQKINYKAYAISQTSNKDLFAYFGRPDAIIHLAWEKLNDYRDEAHTGEILEAHKHFLHNLVKHGAKNITVIGTCYEYGLKEGELKETDPSLPVLPYPHGKNLLREYLEKEQSQLGFSLKWLRVFYVFGAVKGRKNLYTLLLEAVKKGDKTFNMSGGEQVRDFLAPDEIARIIVQTALQNQVQGIINCCSGRPVKLKDFVRSFLDAHGFQLELNLGYYPYADYEPMESWGSVKKLSRITGKNKFEN